MQLEHRVALDPLLESRGSPSATPSDPSLGHYRRRMPSTSRMLLYSAGIFVSYGIFGIVHEAILRQRYGPANERFDFFYSLLFVQCVVNACVARALVLVLRLGIDHTASVYYITGSGLYLIGMAASFAALRYVDYPTQIVVKSAKPLPVMFLGVLFARKRYSLLKWLYVLVIVSGVALFMFEDDRRLVGETRWFGSVLLVLSVAADGLLSTLQEHMRQAPLGGDTKGLHMMYALNAMAVVYMAGVLVLMGRAEFPRFVEFIDRFPRLYGEVGLFALSSAVGQIFICSMIVDFGPLVCSIVTTVRKFFTVLGSVLLFGSELNYRQWFASGLVFGGLVFDASTS